MKYAWRPDIPDSRDRYLALKKVTLPKFVNKLGTSNRIEDQGNLGSCTGNASTSAVEVILKLNTQLSRLMAYYNARTYINAVKEDSGAYIRDALKGLVKIGTSSETTWPYKISKFKTKPSAKAYAQARDLTAALQVFEYARVENLTQLKQALAQGIPVVFGFAVSETFDNLPKSCLLPLPKRGEQMLGGHAVVAVGYDDRPKVPYVWVRNSYGNAWGLGGYFKMTQDWFTDKRRLTDDLWVLRPKT